MTLDALQRKLMAGFEGESADLARKVTQALLDLEGAADADALRGAFDRVARGLHTLKGSAATLGLPDLADMAHMMEDLIASSREALTPPQPAIVDAILGSLDAFTARVQELAAESAGGAPLSGSSGVSPAGEETSTPPSPVTAGTDDEERSWRVDMRQVVSLLDEIERLREVRLRLVERAREVDAALAGLAAPGVARPTAEVRALLGGVKRRLSADGDETASTIESLEEGLKAIATLPVSSALDQLQRAVRDLCRQTGKEARLSAVGAEVSVDRRVLLAVKGALVQLVRNAVAHGIEPPAIREARGKDRAGLVTVRVEPHGNILFVEVEDDGAGLDEERIKRGALRIGVPAEELARLTAPEVHALIFRAGLTTAEQVSEASGRGVGLDLVVEEIESLEGHVEVRTRPGQGTTFVLTVPMELGSSPVLLVRCGEERLGVPVASVERVRRARTEDLEVGATRVHVEHAGEHVRVRDLASSLGLRLPALPEAGRPLLVVAARGRRVVVAVDEVLGHLDLHVRPLPPELRALSAYQGAATLVGGELLLVLRPDWLVEVEETGGTPLATRRALVVDDALTARALYRTILETAGYTVHAASSGKQALDLAKRSTYDVVVCDRGLGDVDGLTVTRELRARSPGLAVVIVSAHDAPADRERALEAGADAFLSKRECAAGRLLAEVSTLAALRPGGRGRVKGQEKT